MKLGTVTKHLVGHFSTNVEWHRTVRSQYLSAYRSHSLLLSIPRVFGQEPIPTPTKQQIQRILPKVKMFEFLYRGIKAKVFDELKRKMRCFVADLVKNGKVFILFSLSCHFDSFKPLVVWVCVWPLRRLGGISHLTCCGSIFSGYINCFWFPRVAAKGASGRILIFPSSRAVPSSLICLKREPALPLVR